MSFLIPEHLIATLLRLRGVRTIVLVTHRLQSVVNCDQIFVMEKGTIAEHGTHGQLIERQDAYARMWEPVLAEHSAS